MDRARTRTEWLDSRHSLAFGAHYDPDDTHFGLLLAHNEDLVQPGPGYPEHVHRDVEILTWVLAGSLMHHDLRHHDLGHHDRAGGCTLVRAGQLHHISAGSGIRHTESSADDQPVRLVQMWLSPDELGGAPRHQVLPVGDRLASGELVELASGLAGPEDQDVRRIRQRGAALSVARLPAGATVTLPAAPYLHVFLATGSVTVENASRDGDGGITDGGITDGGITGADAPGLHTLVAGDALRIAGGGGERVSADQPAELLVWRMR